MKKLLLFLTTLCLFICLFAITAFAVEVDGIYYTISGSGESAYATVSTENRTKCTVADVVIPDTITVENVNYKVTTIASSAFGSTKASSENNQYIKSLTMGGYVQGVGEHAFRNLPYLESVTINNVNAALPISFTNAEFYGCAALKTVSCHEDAKILKYGNYCFWLCSNLESVDFPKTLTSIGSTCFRECAKLNNVDLSGTKITSIGSWAFGSCKALSNFKFPYTLESIGNNAFLYATFEAVVLPKSFTSISQHVFAYCSALKLLVLPEFDAEDTINSDFLHDIKPKVIIYAGSNYDYLKGLSSDFTNYQIKPFSEYVPNTAYDTNTIFYGADTCKTCNGLFGGKEFVFTDMVSEMKDQNLCTNCGGGDVTAYAPILKDLGHTFSVYSNSIMHDIAVNHASLALYNSKMSEDKQITSYGVLAVLKSNVDDATAFDSNGTVKNKVKHIDFSESNYPDFDIWSMKIGGLNPEAKTDAGISYADLEIYICGFMKLGDTVYYINNGTSTTLSGATTLNALIESDN